MKQVISRRPSSMRGYTLLELAIVSTIAMSGVIFGIYWLKFNAYVDQGRSVGQQYITLNDAVNNYIVTYSQQLAQINTSCSETTFAVGTPTSISQARQSAICTLTVAQGKTVANGLQPTASELQALGFLQQSPAQANGLLQIEVPNIKHDNFSGNYVVQADPSFPNGKPNGQYTPTPFRLFINIETICLQRGTVANQNTNPAVPITPGISGCPNTTTTAFKSLIFNTQRYVDKNKESNVSSPALFASVMGKIGNDALTSGLNAPNPSNLGDLYGKNFNIRNPIRVINNSSTPKSNRGLGGIIAMRGGYGASYAMQHSRTDGSNPPTANWDFGAYSINNLNALNTINVNASGKITSPSAEIDSLTTKSLLRIPIRIAGNPCNPFIESIATVQNTDLLVCKNNTWTKFSNSGTVDFTKYKEFYFTVNSAQKYDCTIFTGCIQLSPDPYVITDLTNRISTLNTFMAVSSYLPVVMKYQPDNDQGNTLAGNSGFYISNIPGGIDYMVEARFISGFNLTIRFYPINP